MKKLLVCTAMMLATMGAKAQSAVGEFSIQPKVGMSIANLTDIDDSKSKIGFVAGAEVRYQFHPVVAVEGGLLYSMQGAKIDATADPKFNLEYVNMPIMASFQVYKGLYLRTGVQFGFLTKSEFEIEGSNAKFDGDIKDNTESVDISIPFGASYEYKGFVLDARYNLGLTKTFKSDIKYMEDNLDSKNSVFNITLGYRFTI